MNFSIASVEGGHIALGLALRKLTVSGTFVNSVAHPDDENNALLAQLGYGHGLRVVSVQNNRGDGGENQIGTELFYDIAVLRTSEAQAVRGLDGAEQFYARGIDFGYKWDTDATIRKWGHTDILGDYVRLWRTLRPDVILTMNMSAGGGNRAHEATAILTRESFRAAADPAMYPEQLAEGLRPWQPRKLYFSGALPGAAPDSVRLTHSDTAIYDPLLNRTYAEIGADASSLHRSQAVGGRVTAFPTPPGQAAGAPGASPGFGPGSVRSFQLIDSSIPGAMQKQESSIFDGIDTSLLSIAQYAGPNPPPALTQGLRAILANARQAQSAFDAGNDAATAAPVERGLVAVRALLGQLGSMGLGDAAHYEIAFRLKQKERDFEDAVLAAHYVTFDAVADDGLVIPGQPLQLALTATNNGATDVSITGVDIAGFDSPTSCTPGAARKLAFYRCFSSARVPVDAALTRPYFHDDYWTNPQNSAQMIFDPGTAFGVPNAASPFRATFHIRAGNVEIARDLPLEFRYTKDVFFGDKRMELSVVPELSVRLSPELVVIPRRASAAGTTDREIRVSVTNGAKGPASASIALELPAGWKSIPESAELAFSREDESLPARFVIRGPAHVESGTYPVRAVVTSPDSSKTFKVGYQTIEYPHVQRRQTIEPAETVIKVMDVKVAPDLRVGYIAGTGDQVAAGIAQLGVEVTTLTDDDIAWGDLSQYDAIVTGIRAYQGRDALRAFNRRLLEYVNRGGTLVVQYGPLESNQIQYGPYPASVGKGGLVGIGDPAAPVTVLHPENSVFHFPNEIGPSAWANWIHERGLHFMTERDPRYVDLISIEESARYNPGPQFGALVEARVGRGRWFYVGLGLWRQLPAGTVGGYQLIANLISAGKADAAAAAAAGAR